MKRYPKFNSPELALHFCQKRTHLRKLLEHQKLYQGRGHPETVPTEKNKKQNLFQTKFLSQFYSNKIAFIRFLAVYKTYAAKHHCTAVNTSWPDTPCGAIFPNLWTLLYFYARQCSPSSSKSSHGTSPPEQRSCSVSEASSVTRPWPYQTSMGTSLTAMPETYQPTSNSCTAWKSTHTCLK